MMRGAERSGQYRFFPHVRLSTDGHFGVMNGLLEQVESFVEICLERK